MTDIMIDIETLDTNQTTVVLSIGAVVFDLKTGALGNEYHKTINHHDSLAAGRTKANGTILWWKKQSDAARQQVLGGEQLPWRDALMDFGRWFRKQGPKAIAWGNGATFDIAILENGYQKEYGQTPWEFWAVADVRTVVRLAKLIHCMDPRDFAIKGTAHYALDDAKHQATYVSAMYRKLAGL